jgi:hypothetical protein
VVHAEEHAMLAKVVEVGALSAVCNPTSEGVFFVHSGREWTGERGSAWTDWLARRYRRQGLR